MSAIHLPTVETHPSTEATCSVIWLHGLGASGYDFAGVPGELGLPKDLAVRFIFPHAESIPVTLNGGMVMPAWYDIDSLDTRGHDEAGIAKASESIRALIARENARGVPTERIVLGGFSQGGAMALHAGIRLEERLAGIMGLSCYLLKPDSLEDEAQAANRETPVLLCHGIHDPMVELPMGEASRDRLTSAGWAVQWHDYKMQHSVCAEEVIDIGKWLAARLA